MSLYSFCVRVARKAVLRHYHVTIVNPEKQPESGVLLCCNHISNLDPVVLCAAMTKQVSFMAKKELFTIPVFGTFLRALGMFPVDRGGVDIKAMKKALTLLESGAVVGVFPQGARCPGVDPRQTECKAGVGMILSRSDADVLPVAIVTEENRFRRGRTIYVVFGDRIPHAEVETPGKSRASFERTASIIFGRICDLYDRYRALPAGKVPDALPEAPSAKTEENAPENQ